MVGGHSREGRGRAWCFASDPCSPPQLCLQTLCNFGVEFMDHPTVFKLSSPYFQELKKKLLVLRLEDRHGLRAGREFCLLIPDGCKLCLQRKLGALSLLLNRLFSALGLLRTDGSRVRVSHGKVRGSTCE